MDLLRAAEEGDAAAVRQLLEGKGVDINHTTEEGWSAVILAAKNGHLDTVRLLVEGGAVVTQAEAPHSAIRGAALYGHDSVIEYILSKGARVDCLSGGGRTALMGAAMNGYLSTVRLLLASGADPAVRNSFGETAADLAKADDVKQALLPQAGGNA